MRFFVWEKVTVLQCVVERFILNLKAIICDDKSLFTKITGTDVISVCFMLQVSYNKVGI